MDYVERDRLLPRSQRKRVDRITLNSLVAWLQNRGYSPKTVRIYVDAVQSLAKYFDIPISLRYVQLPPAQPVNKKHPWTVEEVGDFIASMDEPAYKSIAASIVQSGLSVPDLLALKYGDIKEEFEKGTTPVCLSLTRKKTQRKILENHNQKIPRLQNQRKRPTNILVHNTKTHKAVN